MVGDDLDLLRLRADHVGEEGADDGDHARGEDDDGDIVGDGPVEEGGEARVELYVRNEEADAVRSLVS